MMPSVTLKTAKAIIVLAFWIGMFIILFESKGIYLHWTVKSQVSVSATVEEYFYHETTTDMEDNAIPGNERYVLVTGGAGFIGHHVIMRLKHLGMKVIGIDNFNDYYNVSLKYARANISAKVVHLDVCDFDGLQNIIETLNISHIIHLAAQAGVRYSLTNPMAYIRSNVECFLKLLEAIKHKNIPLIYASSSSVYGKNKQTPFSEHDRVDHPASLYAATKRDNELTAHVYWNVYKQRSLGLRFFTVYGPLGRPDMAYYSFVKNIDEGKPINIYNYGKLSRDFTYIDDVVDGIIQSLDTYYQCEIINLGRGEPQELMTFVQNIEQSLKKKAICNYVDMAKGDVLVTYANITKAKNILGYSPRISLNMGISKFVEWYKSTK